MHGTAAYLGMRMFDGFLQSQVVYYHEIMFFMALPWLHRIWPWTFERLSNQIVQVDLVMNWAELKEDFVCRHLRLTNRLGQEEFVAIS